MREAAWYVDSSVVLRALVNRSAAAQTWLQGVISRGEALYGSRMLELEVRRVIRNTGQPQYVADDCLARFQLITITDDLIDDAIALPYPTGAGDSLHLATAIQIATLPLTLVTHDAQMARAAQAIGRFPVIDPVTDDPLRPPAAPPQRTDSQPS